MLYVVAQFLLLAVIAWPLASLSLSMIGITLIIFSFCIALSAFMVNQPGNFNVRPTPKITGKLVVHGPYKFIRHPMYTSLFFGGLGILFCQFSFWKLVAWSLLILVLSLKARFEERALSAHHQAYADYQKTNKAFIPWIW
jgi:protein-S-isoprenylcysteine O-methyltransferase Ste14